VPLDIEAQNPPAPAPRATGECAPDAPPLTRERLLDAAERLFSQKGYRAASVREITQAAGTNLAAVNYHFGSKAELYHEVFVRRLTWLRERRLQAVEQALARAGDDALDRFVEAFAQAFVEPLVAGDAGRRWLNLFSREMLDPQLPAGFFYREILRPTHGALADALCRARPGLDPAAARLCVQSAIGQLLYVIQLQRMAVNTGDDEAARAYALPRLLAHAVRFTTAGIRHLEAPGT
jgi:AcrR family transcriptional regulator